MASRRPSLAILVFISVCSVFSLGQQAVQTNKKPQSTKIDNAVLVIWEPVVTRQWPVLRQLVNVPADLAHVEPGQCVRFGVLATGDARDTLLEASTFEVQVVSAGKTLSVPSESAAAIKRLKPQGGDFVSQALGAAGISAPDMSMVSLAATKARWCAPIDAVSGKVAVSIKVSGPSGKPAGALTRSLPLQSFSDARQTPPFEDMGALAGWLQSYHRAPTPSLLLPALRIVATDDRASNSWNMLQFFVAALRDSPAAAQELVARLPRESLQVRTMGEVLVAKAGYENLLTSLPDDKLQTISSFKFPDPFDLTPDQDLATRMDMMWATLFATGEAKTVTSIASMLAWRSDYEAFVDMQKAGKKPTQLTESIMRGVTYGAAGWSLSALSQSNGLVADYLDALKASGETPAVVKSELAGLSSNPAFRQNKPGSAKK